MKHSLSISLMLLALGLSACSMKPYEKTAQLQAQQAGLVAVAKPQLDATYVAPGVKLATYKKLDIAKLDFSLVKIIDPHVSTYNDQKWELNDSDRAYYQEKYETAAKHSLLESGRFTAAGEPAADTLVLRAKILEIAPLGPKDDLKSRPTLMDVYSEGFGRMTVAFEFYDAKTNQLVFAATDEHDLGRMWEKNTRVQNNMQVRLAFDYWLSALQKQLDVLSK